MCGIAGLVDFQAAPEEATLRAMERALSHRGPDDAGLFRTACCGLVHRRLRIIDLSPAAAQPMANEDGRLQVVFNGEIYNFRALRAELEGLGHRFRSRSDTEVLVHGYESWGLKLLTRLRGMFALALWDEAAQRLLLARDRLGKKPLFYSVNSARLAFGSELNVFKAIPHWRLKLSIAGFRQYVEYGYVPGSESILEGVHRLLPGHYAIWDRAGLTLERYWSLPTESSSHHEGGAAEAAQALEGSLREAVACRLESDVPLGCFLSGGIDSSLVAALAQESLGSPLKTFTVNFEDSATSEAVHARAVAKHLGTEHRELSVSSALVLEQFEEILSGAAEPLGDDSYVPTFLICRETRRNVTVAISGDGGDELFAGYTKYRQFRSARQFQRWPLPWKLLSRCAWNDRSGKSLQALATGSPLELARWLSSLWKRRELPRLLAPSSPSGVQADRFEQSWNQRAAYPEIERWMLADMENYLEGDILTKVDRASMAVGLETRSPFLDSEFVAAALSWRVRAELNGGGKSILKTMLAQRLPAALFERSKQGFGMPVDAWFRGSLRELLQRYASPDRIRQRGLLQVETVNLAVEQHLSGRRNFGRKLYALVAFEIWAEQFFGRNSRLA
jgi:asparagine synthase (glutamine-hydrolysing)